MMAPKQSRLQPSTTVWPSLSSTPTTGAPIRFNGHGYQWYTHTFFSLSPSFSLCMSLSFPLGSLYLVVINILVRLLGWCLSKSPLVLSASAWLGAFLASPVGQTSVFAGNCCQGFAFVGQRRFCRGARYVF